MVKVNTAVVALAISFGAGAIAAPARSVPIYAREPEPFSLSDIVDAGKAGVNFVKEHIAKKTSTAAPVPIEIPQAIDTTAVLPVEPATVVPTLLQAREAEPDPFSVEDAINKAKQIGTEAKAIFKSVFHKDTPAPFPVAEAPLVPEAVDPAAAAPIDPTLLQAREPEPEPLFEEIVAKAKEIKTTVKSLLHKPQAQPQQLEAAPLVVPTLDPAADPALLQAREPEPLFDSLKAKAKAIKDKIKGFFGKGTAPAALPPTTAVDPVIAGTVDTTLAAPAGIPLDPAADPALLQAREPEPLSFDEVITKAKEIGSEVKTIVGGFLHKGQAAAPLPAAAAVPEQVAVAQDPAAEVVDPNAVPVARRSGGMLKVRRFVVEEDEE